MKTLGKLLLCALTAAWLPQAYGQDDSILALTGAASIEELNEEEYERLESLRASPIPINIASPARLQSCGLFSRFQVLSLSDYRAQNGDVLSVTELGLIDGFDEESARRLAPFLSFDTRSKAGAVTRKRNSWDLMARGEERNGLWGYAAKGRFVREGRWSASATTRATATARPGVPDTWSFNLTYSFRRRPGKILVGDYNARFGQGLALWNGFSLGGLTTAESFARHPSGLSPSWSLSPDAPLRGAAADLSWRRWTFSALSVFPGLRTRMDGNHEAPVSVFGAVNAAWTGRKAESSATVLLAPSTSGLTSRASVDFRWTPGKLGSFGEAVWDFHSRQGAFVGGLIWSPAYQKKVSVALRHYPAGFPSTLVGGIRAGSRCSGESGCALGFRLPWLRLSTDYARFPVKQQAQLKCVCILPLTYKERLSFTPRASLRWRNGTRREEYRLEAAWMPALWQVKLRADAVRCAGFAWLGYLETGRKTDVWQCYARSGLFCVDHWDDRIYVYERDAPGCFNVPAYYGRGYSASLVGGFHLKRHKFFLRAGFIHYVTDKPDRFECRLQYSWSR